MNIDDAFPSKYISAADLRGQEVPVTISNVVIEQVQGNQVVEDRPIAYFQGKNKGLVLNKTNAGVIRDAFGPETSNWYGRQLMLYTVQTQTPRGEPTQGVRVRAITAVAATPPVQQQPVQPAQESTGATDPFALDNQPVEAQQNPPLDDEIPF